MSAGATQELLRLAATILVVVALFGLWIFYIRRARRKPEAVREEQRQAAEMLDIEPPRDGPGPGDPR